MGYTAPAHRDSPQSRRPHLFVRASDHRTQVLFQAIIYALHNHSVGATGAATKATSSPPFSLPLVQRDVVAILVILLFGTACFSRGFALGIILPMLRLSWKLVVSPEGSSPFLKHPRLSEPVLAREDPVLVDASFRPLPATGFPDTGMMMQSTPLVTTTSRTRRQGMVPCPKCQAKMSIRTAKAGGKLWGCAQFTLELNCRGTRTIEKVRRMMAIEGCDLAVPGHAQIPITTTGGGD